MYLALRVTSNRLFPILLHASTEPTLFLFSEHPAASSPFGLLPSLSTCLVIPTGLIVLIVSERRRARHARALDSIMSAVA